MEYDIIFQGFLGFLKAFILLVSFLSLSEVHFSLHLSLSGTLVCILECKRHCCYSAVHLSLYTAGRFEPTPSGVVTTDICRYPFRNLRFFGTLLVHLQCYVY